MPKVIIVKSKNFDPTLGGGIFMLFYQYSINSINILINSRISWSLFCNWHTVCTWMLFINVLLYQKYLHMVVIPLWPFSFFLSYILRPEKNLIILEREWINEWINK